MQTVRREGRCQFIRKKNCGQMMEKMKCLFSMFTQETLYFAKKSVYEHY